MAAKYFIVIGFLMVSLVASAQVDRSIEQSAQESRASDPERDSDNGVLVDILLFLPHWQSYKLKKDRQVYPPMVSLDGMIQGAYKPEDTYLFWPRIRANWGLFTTDFRMNYLVEKDDSGNLTHMRTTDWQILQLNVITSRFITFRAGGGFMQEAYGSNEQFFEFTSTFGIHAPDHTNAFYIEYRQAQDWDDDVTARLELSGQYQHQLFQTGGLRGYLTIGAVYQKYYSTFDLWGIHGGLVFKLY